MPIYPYVMAAFDADRPDLATVPAECATAGVAGLVWGSVVVDDEIVGGLLSATELDAAALAVLASVEAAHELHAARVWRLAEIDARSEVLIAQGFAFAGKVFSMSTVAQINLTALNASRDDPAITYPINYNAVDDSGVHAIADAAELRTMYLTALGTKRAWLDAGTAIKTAIRAATTAAEVLAVEDQR